MPQQKDRSYKDKDAKDDKTYRNDPKRDDFDGDGFTRKKGEPAAPDAKDKSTETTTRTAKRK